MLFWFKKKKITLDCYTYYSHAHEFFKIESARTFIPSWWKNLPTSYKDERSLADHPTMKTCLGFNNNFRHGFIMPLWTDTFFSLAQTGPRQWGVAGQNADSSTEIESHSPKQWGDFIDSDAYMHVKIKSPWLFICNEEIDWTWTQPSWNTSAYDEYLVLPGITDFKYQSSTNINIISRRFNRNNQPNVVKIEAGQPLVHIVPITEREVEVRNHLVTLDEYRNLDMRNTHISYLNNYAKTRSMRKKNEEAKCPFNFGRK